MSPNCETDAETLMKWKAAILDRCPVGDNLKNATEIDVKLAKHEAKLA